MATMTIRSAAVALFGSESDSELGSDYDSDLDRELISGDVLEITLVWSSSH